MPRTTFEIVQDMKDSVYGDGYRDFPSTNVFYLEGSFGGAKLIGIEDPEGGDAEQRIQRRRAGSGQHLQR